MRRKVTTKLRPHSIFSIFFVLILFFVKISTCGSRKSTILRYAAATATITVTATVTTIVTATVASRFLLDLRPPQVKKNQKIHTKKTVKTGWGKREIRRNIFQQCRLAAQVDSKNPNLYKKSTIAS